MLQASSGCLAVPQCVYNAKQKRFPWQVLMEEHMIKGIGVDSVYIPDIKHYLGDERLSDAFVRRTFTDAERAAAEERANKAEFFAGRFAAKEAAFKAVAPLTKAESFDLRIVETLNAEDGHPYVNVTKKLAEILAEADVDTLHVSITGEHEYATAFVIAERR